MKQDTIMVEKEKKNAKNKSKIDPNLFQQLVSSLSDIKAGRIRKVR